MLGMPSTPHLLLAALAVLAGMRGRVDGAIGCDGNLLQDTAKCWAPELNAAFDGKLTGCEDGWVYADEQADCDTTAANINKNDKYKGPPISCSDSGVDVYFNLGWSSAVDCTNGSKIMIEVFTSKCNGKPDPLSCQADYAGEYAGKCNDVVIGSIVRENCPVMCSTCEPACNGKPDPDYCQTDYAGKCNSTVIGSLVRGNCPVMCGATCCYGRREPPYCQTDYAGKCNDTVIGSLVRGNCPLMCGGTCGPACNGKPDPLSCWVEYAGKCNDVVIGSLVRENCPVMCSTCGPPTPSPAPPPAPSPAPSPAPPPTCNAACIPKGVKLKAGKLDCCSGGKESLKCPGPAHYRCGVHALLSNQTAATATSNAPPVEQ